MTSEELRRIAIETAGAKFQAPPKPVSVQDLIAEQYRIAVHDREEATKRSDRLALLRDLTASIPNLGAVLELMEAAGLIERGEELLPEDD